jgi:hypothetical protein
MIDILTMSAELLTESGFTTSHIQVSKREAIAFEDPTVLGFLFDYSTPQALLDSWVSDTNRTIADHQMALRRAGQKAWNTYAVMLAAEPADYQGLVALAGIQSMADLRVALLTLLPIQSAPKLEAVDLVAEIRIRTSGMSARAIDAFLSNAEESVVLQVLEQEP